MLGGTKAKPPLSRYPISQPWETSAWYTGEYSLLLIPAYVWGVYPSERAGWVDVQGIMVQGIKATKDAVSVAYT